MYEVAHLTKRDSGTSLNKADHHSSVNYLDVFPYLTEFCGNSFFGSTFADVRYLSF